MEAKAYLRYVRISPRKVQIGQQSLAPDLDPRFGR